MFKRLFCSHPFYKMVRIRTVHGDEIIHTNWTRSYWKCECGKIKRSSRLDCIIPN